MTRRISSLLGTTTLFGSILSSKQLALQHTPPPPLPAFRFGGVQERNAALAGGCQTLDAEETEERLGSQVGRELKRCCCRFGSRSHELQSFEAIARAAPAMFASWS